MVLNDGETYTGLAGCKIVEIPDDFDGEPDAAIKEACYGNEDEGVEVLYTFTGHESQRITRMPDELFDEMCANWDDDDAAEAVRGVIDTWLANNNILI